MASKTKTSGSNGTATGVNRIADIDLREDGSKAGVRVARAKIVGASPIFFSKSFPPDATRAVDEKHDDFDARLCRERGHYDTQGRLVIPGVMVQKTLRAAAKFRGEKIPGQGQKTWTKRFGAGVMVTEDFLIQPEVTRDTVKIKPIFVPSDGKPGSTASRVWRRFPYVEEWQAELVVHVLDGLIDEETFLKHLQTAGMYDGLGSFRPGSPSPNVYGRFGVADISWGVADI